MSEINNLKESIAHCKRIEQSCGNESCVVDHKQLRLWLEELLLIKESGLGNIANERKRQIDVEGWDLEHDDIANNDEQLARAAAIYALPDDYRHFDFEIRNIFPWDMSWWKPVPNNRIRELEKAGALIVAEIDRLKRVDANLKVRGLIEEVKRGGKPSFTGFSLTNEQLDELKPYVTDNRYWECLTARKRRSEGENY